MINLCWFEDGEWKQLELHCDDATRAALIQFEKLKQKHGQPIAFLEHPVTYMLIPLFSSLLPIRREVFRDDGDEAGMNRELARFIDSRDKSDRAFKYVSWQQHLADKDARIAKLEAELATAVEMLNEEQEERE